MKVLIRSLEAKYMNTSTLSKEDPEFKQIGTQIEFTVFLGHSFNTHGDLYVERTVDFNEAEKAVEEELKKQKIFDNKK